MPVVGATPVVWSDASGFSGQIRCCLWLVVLAVVLHRSEPKAMGISTIRDSLNKAVHGGASHPADLGFLALLLVIVVMGGDGSGRFVAGLPRSEAPWGFLAVFSAMFNQSSSSMAPS